MAPPSPNKTPMREQPALERIRNFQEVPFGYSEEEAVSEARRCIKCRKPLCITGCPVEIDIPRFIAVITDGRFRDAARIIRKKNILPAVCGRVCPQEDQCEKLCILGKKMEPVAIGRLERFCADWDADCEDQRAPTPFFTTGKKVAVVGTGPAGLTVAYDLRLLGHTVTMFEALHRAGGVLVYGIPEFRLPKRIVSREIDQIGRAHV
jgi:glutamate synthase (NADPH/NADH) small chain